MKRNSQPNRLSAFFKGRKTSATGKHPTDDEEQSDSSNTSKDSERVKKEVKEQLSNDPESLSKSSQAEYLIVLHRILQEQIINTKEVYRIAGHTITVEVLEDTEL